FAKAIRRRSRASSTAPVFSDTASRDSCTRRRIQKRETTLWQKKLRRQRLPWPSAAAWPRTNEQALSTLQRKANKQELARRPTPSEIAAGGGRGGPTTAALRRS